MIAPNLRVTKAFEPWQWLDDSPARSFDVGEILTPVHREHGQIVWSDLVGAYFKLSDKNINDNTEPAPFPMNLRMGIADPAPNADDLAMAADVPLKVRIQEALDEAHADDHKSPDPDEGPLPDRYIMTAPFLIPTGEVPVGSTVVRVGPKDDGSDAQVFEFLSGDTLHRFAMSNNEANAFLTPHPESV